MTAPSLPTHLTVTIIALNEAARLGRCLASVASVADEIVVIDSGSTDGTQDLARSMGATVIFNAWAGYGPQKRFAELAASHDYILNLDADEWLTPELAGEIAALKARSFDGYGFFRMRIATVYPHQDRPRLFADDYHLIRLYDRRRGGYPDSPIFDTVKTDQPEARLTHDVWHQSIISLDQLRQKELRYFKLQAETIKAGPAKLRRWKRRRPFEYAFQFLKYYFLKRHCLGGWFGFQVALLAADVRAQRLRFLIAANSPDLQS